MTRHLILEDLLAIVDELGVGPVRDIGLLDAAVHRPRSTLFGVDAYPDLDTKAAALLHSLVRNHCLVDGNERLSWVAVVVFYSINDVSLEALEDPAYDLVIDASTGAVDVGEIARTLATWRTR